MPADHQLDSKFFTVSTVRVLNLKIDVAPPEEFPLSDLCKLPSVQLEKLDLEMAPPAPDVTRLKIPKVSLEKLDLGLPLSLTHSSPRQPPVLNGFPGGFFKVPVVSLRSCDAPSTSRKKVSFTLPEKSSSKSRDDVMSRCFVRVRRDDLHKLKASLQKLDKPESCKLCGKVYLSKKKLSKHQERKHDLVLNLSRENGGKACKKKRVSFSKQVIVHTVAYHRCRKCLKVFQNYKILKMHMKSQHKKRTCYVCDYCKKSFADRTIFKVHIKLHCVRCSQLFLEKKELVQHRKTTCHIRATRKIACATCSETYYSNLSLKDHSFGHLEVPKMICDVCKDQFSGACPLMRHLYYSHSKRRNGLDESTQYTVKKTGSLKVYKCKFCSETFIDKSDMEKHIRSEAATSIENKYGDHKCNYCPKKFKIEKNLLLHMWSHLPGAVSTEQPSHEIPTIDLTEESKMPSQEPVEKIQQKEAAITKMNQKETSLRRKRAVAVNGTQSDTVSTSYEQQCKKQRRPVKPHSCSTCDKLLSSKSSLNRHMKLHMDMANLRCHVCEETFAWPSLLRDHKCIRSRTEPDGFYLEVPVLSAEYCKSLGLEEELPTTQDVTTHIDFELPAPVFEFAGIPESFPAVVHDVSAAPAEIGARGAQLPLEGSAPGGTHRALAPLYTLYRKSLDTAFNKFQ